jgi:hypothetical protein
VTMQCGATKTSALTRTDLQDNEELRHTAHLAPDPGRVRARIFLCMPAYYVEWHMRDALAPLLFDDEKLGDTQ